MDRTRLRRALDERAQGEPCSSSLLQQVDAGAELSSVDRLRAEPALAMMRLRAEGVPDAPVDLRRLVELAAADPTRRLTAYYVTGAPTEGQVLLDEDDAVIVCWVIPGGPRAVDAMVPPTR